MSRKFCVGGNWKMNGSKAEIAEICKGLTAGPLDPNTEVVVGVPAPYISYARSLLPAAIGVAGQVSNFKTIVQFIQLTTGPFRIVIKWPKAHLPAKSLRLC